jgi:VanZ family protein
MAVVLAMSSPQMSAENTGSLIRPLLAWVGLAPAHVDLVHGLVRKGAHVTEYAILAALWRRAFARGVGGGPALHTALALGISVGCAVIDETHQSFLAARTGAVRDVMLDSFGALAAVGAAHLGWWRAADLATGLLLWLAIVGGVGALALHLAAGAAGGVLWLTVPAAAALQIYRWRRRTSSGG